MRVLVINNYSMKQTLKWVEDQIFPAQHCWGCDRLQENGAKLRFALYNIPRLVLKFHVGRVFYYFLLIFFGCYVV